MREPHRPCSVSTIICCSAALSRTLRPFSPDRRKPSALRNGSNGFAACAGKDATFSMTFLDDEIEILRPDLPRGRFRSVIFDFDGTLSLIREGWPQVMIPMMVRALRATATAKPTKP